MAQNGIAQARRSAAPQGVLPFGPASNNGVAAALRATPTLCDHLLDAGPDNEGLQQTGTALHLRPLASRPGVQGRAGS